MEIKGFLFKIKGVLKSFQNKTGLDPFQRLLTNIFGYHKACLRFGMLLVLNYVRTSAGIRRAMSSDNFEELDII